MKHYTTKHTIKLIVFSTATLFVLASTMLLYNAIRKIKEEEKKQVLLWADAIQKRYMLVDYTNKLFEKLQQEERKKVETWSDAQYHLLSTDDSQFLTFLLQIIRDNKTIPIILTDASDIVVSTNNIDYDVPLNKPLSKELKRKFTLYNPLTIRYEQTIINYLYYADSKIFTDLQDIMHNMVQSFIDDVVKNTASVPVIVTNKDTSEIIAHGNVEIQKLQNKQYIQSIIESTQHNYKAIPIQSAQAISHIIFYEDSKFLTRLRYYPPLLLLFGVAVALLAYIGLKYSERNEKNLLLVGMSKETAHQLGTPISSLMAWSQLIEAQGVEPTIIEEINKDITRLNKITERFSNIGSAPKVQAYNLYEHIVGAIEYLKKRSSHKITFIIECNQKDIIVNLNSVLFEWVIENVCKNAIDAMQGQGMLHIHIGTEHAFTFIDIKDTGKGINRSAFKTIFSPGYTTKNRGWGLGLSLAKRIIEEYHHGKIFVKHSEPNKFTVIRILLPYTLQTT